MLWHALRRDMNDAAEGEREEIVTALRRLTGVPQVEAVCASAMIINDPGVIGMVIPLTTVDDLATCRAHPQPPANAHAHPAVRTEALALDLTPGLKRSRAFGSPNFKIGLLPIANSQ